MNKLNLQKTNGFTLLEVLISLTILAISLTALKKANSSITKNTILIREKIIASNVAMQSLNIIELGLLPNETRQKTKMFNTNWIWKTKKINNSTYLLTVNRLNKTKPSFKIMTNLIK